MQKKVNSSSSSEKPDPNAANSLRNYAVRESNQNYQSVVSKETFNFIDEAIPGGSSPVRAWYLDKDGRKWFGKCSMETLVYGIVTGGEPYQCWNFPDYKECLAIRLYSLFSVKTPETVISLQLVNPVDRAQQEKQAKQENQDIYLDLPRVHVMSRFVEGFQALGDSFLERYKENEPQNSSLHVGGKPKYPLRGLGRVMAVAILLLDYDCIGNSGGNMGYVLNHDEKYAEIVKIDPGEALPFVIDMSKTNLVVPIKEKQAILGTNGSRFPYSEMRSNDKEEFIQTAMEILETPDSRIEEVFREFLGLDERFQKTLNCLLIRQRELLSAFSSEVRDLIVSRMAKANASKAEKLMRKWGNQSKLIQQLESETKSELVLNSARLGAISVAENHIFVGRELELSQIKKYFAINRNVVGCAIVGGAGFGKSHLATEYISKYHEELYLKVISFNAEQGALIPDQMQIYLQTSFKVKLDSESRDKAAIIDQFYRVLDGNRDATSKRKYCILFDNAESMTQIAEFLPDAGSYPELNIDVLVTSRFRNWEKPFYTVIEMRAFGEKDIENYIEKYFSHQANWAQRDKTLTDAVARLNELLGGLPLAISQAIAYIHQNKISVSAYCDLITKSRKEIIPFQRRTELANGEGSESLDLISPTLTLALADLRVKNQHVESVLDVLAYLSPEDINKKLLREGWERCSRKKSDHKVFEEALELMASYSLISLHPENLIRIDGNELTPDVMQVKVHRLTQQVVRLNHQMSTVYESRYLSVFDWVSTQLSFNQREVVDVGRAGLFIPHGIHLEKHWDRFDEGKLEEIKLAELFHKIADHQSEVGKYHTAIEYYQKALGIKRNYYGRDHLAISYVLEGLGGAWAATGNINEFKEAATRVVEITTKHLGKNHPETALSYANLGTAYGELCNYEKQIELLTKVIDPIEKHYGKDHIWTADIFQSLATAYKALDNQQKYKEFYRRALDIFEKYYGPDHPMTATIILNLEHEWGNFEDTQKQKDIFIRLVNIFEKYYGKDHPKTAFALANLALAWGKSGDIEKKREQLSQALEILERHYGKGHRNLEWPLTQLGIAWGELGNFEKHKEFSSQALEIIEKHYGKFHKRTAEALHDLAIASRNLCQYEKQIELLTRALEIDEKYYGKNHPSLGPILVDLGIA